MTHFYKTILILILLVITSSNNGQKLDNSSLIDIDVNIKSMEVINLSLFTDNIKYVPLDNKVNFTMGSNTEINISKDLILIGTGNGCFLFDKEGHFISKIGSIGRGPGEYPYIKNLSLGKDGKVYLSDLYNLYEYNVNGTFVNKYTNSFRLSNENEIISRWLLIDDSLFFGHIPNSTGLIGYKAIIINKRGHIKQTYKNYILFNRSKPVASTMENQANIYNFNNQIVYKALYNDTLFYLSAKYKLIPKYTFNLGKYKEPLSARENIEPYKYIHLFNAFQTHNYLFLDFLFGDHFPAKRFTPKPTPFSVPEPIMHNTLNTLGIYNKTTGNLVFSKPTSTDNKLFTSGIYNDIDAGPRFFPKVQVNDSTMLMWMTAKDLKDHVASDDFKNNVPKYPDKKRMLEEISKNLTEFDNAVLMFVTIKK